jgi:hypothetical protein
MCFAYHAICQITSILNWKMKVFLSRKFPLFFPLTQFRISFKGIFQFVEAESSWLLLAVRKFRKGGDGCPLQIFRQSKSFFWVSLYYEIKIGIITEMKLFNLQGYIQVVSFLFDVDRVVQVFHFNIYRW